MPGRLPRAWRLRFLARALARLVWCAAGAAAGLGLVFWLVDPPSSPLWLASLGGTAVFLFGLTRAPAAQPRALVGGHLSGALIGVLCFQAFGDATWVYLLALVLSLIVMLATKTVHPPAGANPLIMVHAHAGISAVLNPVGLGVLILALLPLLGVVSSPAQSVIHPVGWRSRLLHSSGVVGSSEPVAPP